MVAPVILPMVMPVVALAEPPTSPARPQPVSFAQAFADLLEARAKNSVGLKTIVAYRCTFRIDQTAPDRAAVAPQLIFNQQLDGWLTVFFLLVVWTIVIDMARGCWQHLSGSRPARDTEAPYVATQLT